MYGLLEKDILRAVYQRQHINGTFMAHTPIHLYIYEKIKKARNMYTSIGRQGDHLVLLLLTLPSLSSECTHAVVIIHTSRTAGKRFGKINEDDDVVNYDCGSVCEDRFHMVGECSLLCTTTRERNLRVNWGKSMDAIEGSLNHVGITETRR